MNCPYLKGKTIKQCGAVNCAVVMNGNELAEFCKSPNHVNCPVYIAKSGKDGSLNLKEYYAIYARWTKSMPSPGLADKKAS